MVIELADSGSDRKEDNPWRCTDRDYHTYRYSNSDHREDLTILPIQGNQGGLGANRDDASSSRIKKIVLGATLFACLAFVIVDSATNRHVERSLQKFLLWVEVNPAAGFFSFILVYFLATVLFFPVALLTLGGGYVFANTFGLWVGVALSVIAVFVGASSGAIVAFCLGRYLLRDWVMTLADKFATFEAIDRVIGDKGLRILVLLHLCPIVPFNALNYLSGTTAVPLLTFVWALVAILPGTTVYVFLGATAESLVSTSSSGGKRTSTVEIVMVVLGLVFGIVGIAITSYYAKKELDKVMEEKKGETDEARRLDMTSDENILT